MGVYDLALTNFPYVDRATAVRIMRETAQASSALSQEIEANGGEPPDFPPEPEPSATELFHRRSVEISNQSRVDGADSGE